MASRGSSLGKILDDSDASHTRRELGQHVYQLINLAPGNFTLTASSGHVPSPLSLSRVMGSQLKHSFLFPPSCFDPGALISFSRTEKHQHLTQFLTFYYFSTSQQTPEPPKLPLTNVVADKKFNINIVRWNLSPNWEGTSRVAVPFSEDNLQAASTSCACADLRCQALGTMALYTARLP